jgi:two-component system, response regulator RegA
MTNPPEPSRTVLIVEDDDRLRERLARALSDRGYETRQAADGEAALLAAHEDCPEYLLVDLRMPGGRSGLDVVRDIKAIDPATVAVVLTGYGSIATAVEAVRLGADEYLTKPAEGDQIIAAFNRSSSLPATGGEPEQVPSLARVEWEHINRVLADCGGNVSKAARLLGIHRRSLQRKLGRFPSSR